MPTFPAVFSGHQKRQKVTVLASEVVGSHDDFVFPVDLGDLDSAIFNYPDSIRVALSDEETEVNFEIESPDSGGSSKGALHILADNVNDSTNAEFWIYYDDPLASAKPGSWDEGVWADRKLTHHFDPPYGSSLIDSTANSHDATPVNFTSGQYENDGLKGGKSMVFDGNDLADFGAIAYNNLRPQTYIWIGSISDLPSAVGDDFIILGKYYNNSTASIFIFGINSSDKFFFKKWHSGSSNEIAEASTVFTEADLDVEMMLSFVHRNDGSWDIYINGQLDNSGSFSFNASLSNTFTKVKFGEGHLGNKNFYGKMIEMQVLWGSEESSNWMETLYNAWFSSFYSVSAVEENTPDFLPQVIFLS